jgi:hypothetical protein
VGDEPPVHIETEVTMDEDLVAAAQGAPTFNGRASGSRVCWFEHDDGRLHGATTSEGLVIGLNG